MRKILSFERLNLNCGKKIGLPWIGFPAQGHLGLNDEESEGGATARVFPKRRP